MAEEINQFRLEQKEKQSNYLKQKRDKNLLKTTNYSEIDSKHFSRLIELTIGKESFSEIRNEIEIRLAAGQLTNTDLSGILFKTKDRQLQQLIFDSIDEKTLVNLLDNGAKILKEINHLKYEEIIYTPKKLIFISRLIVTFNNQDLTPSDIVKGKNKKDAKTQAYKVWLSAYINQELVPPSELSELENDLTVLEPEVVELQHKLPLSTLNNLCQQRTGGKPSFEYQQQDGIFICTVTVKLKENTISKVGKATKKRTAQNIAADKILSELDTLIDQNP